MWKKNKWNYLVEEVRRVMKLTKEETSLLRENHNAELLAALAFISKCKDPERFAMAHLLTFTAEAYRQCSIFDQKKEESSFDRLLPLLLYPEGNQIVIRAGFFLLQLSTIIHHKNKLVEDIANNDNNVLINKDYKKEYNILLEKYENIIMKLNDHDKKEIESFRAIILLGGFWA